MSKVNWFIVKTPEGHCQIISLDAQSTPEKSDFWGPFSSQQEALAKRIGLIRAGKCQPL